MTQVNNHSEFLAPKKILATKSRKRLRFFEEKGISANKGLPLPLGRGVCETKSKNGPARPRKPFFSKVFCAQRGIETMVSDHGLRRGQTMG